MTRRIGRLGYSCATRRRYSMVVEGKAIEICEDVYEPAEDTWMLYRLIEALRKRYTVCIDVGTGTGVLAAVLKKLCSYVVAVDVSPCAVTCSSKIIDERIDLVQCDTVTCIRGDAATLIVFNAPYLPGQPGSIAELGWHGGAEILEQVLRALSGWRRCWELLVTVSSVSPEERVLKTANALDILGRRLQCIHEDFFVETCVYIFTPRRCASRMQRWTG